MAESILTQRNFVFLLQAVSLTSQRCILLFANAALRKHIENLLAYLRFQFPYTCFIFIAHGSFNAHPLLTLWMMSWLPLYGAHDAADLASREQA